MVSAEKKLGMGSAFVPHRGNMIPTWTYLLTTTLAMGKRNRGKTCRTLTKLLRVCFKITIIRLHV